MDVHDILRNNYISKKQCFKISLTHFLQTYFQKRWIFPQDHFTSGWPSILSNEVHEYLPGCLWYDSDRRSFQDWYRRFGKRRLLLWCTPFWPSLQQKSWITLLLLRKTIRYKLSVYHYWINNWLNWVFCCCLFISLKLQNIFFLLNMYRNSSWPRLPSISFTFTYVIRWYLPLKWWGVLGSYVF